MCIFSNFKNIFGKENTGIHKYKFVNTSIVDYIGTIIIALIITYITKFPLVLTTIILFIIGIIGHILFGVNSGSTFPILILMLSLLSLFQ